MSAKQTHIAVSHSPLDENVTQKSLCGIDVPNVIFTLRYVAGELQTKEFSTLVFCRKCVRELADIGGIKGREYVYGIRDRQFMKQAEEGDAA